MPSTCFCFGWSDCDNFSAISAKFRISASVDNMARIGLAGAASGETGASFSPPDPSPDGVRYIGDCSSDSNNLRSGGPGDFFPNSIIEM